MAGSASGSRVQVNCRQGISLFLMNATFPSSVSNRRVNVVAEVILFYILSRDHGDLRTITQNLSAMLALPELPGWVPELADASSAGIAPTKEEAGLHESSDEIINFLVGTRISYVQVNRFCL